MESIKRAAVVAVVIFALGVLMSVGDAIETAGETVRQFAPIPQATAQIALDRREQEAQVTATYLAVLGSEIVSDTQNTHTLMRQANAQRHSRAMALEQVVNLSTMLLWIACSVAVSIASIGIGYGIARRASTTHLRDGAYLLPSGNWIDTRTALVSGTKQERLPEMHSRDLIEYRTTVVKALASAFVENGGVKLFNRER